MAELRIWFVRRARNRSQLSGAFDETVWIVIALPPHVAIDLPN